MKIGIITAMPEEFRAVADSLGSGSASRLGTYRARRFSTGGHEFLLVESGMGLANAAAAAEAIVCDGYQDLLITTGFCGGIAPEAEAGDIVVAKKILIANEEGVEEIPVQLSDIGLTFIAQQANSGTRVAGGVFVSTSVVTSKKQLASLLSGQHLSPVVEMESAAVAIVAAESGIPLLALRAVSDTAAEELGFSLADFCDPDMKRIRVHKVLMTVVRKPGIIPQLVRLSFSSRTAAKSMTAALSRLFSGLCSAARR